jgi:formylglycine-generating enzyme
MRSHSLIFPAVAAAFFSLGFVPSCRCNDKSPPEPQPDADALPSASSVPSALPSASASAQPPTGHCPQDMVRVAERYCVDRYESTMVDEQGRQASPYYPILDGKYPAWLDARKAEASRLEVEASPDAKSASTPFPSLPEWQRSGATQVRAVTRAGQIPNAYLSMFSSRDACMKAGKRLCTLQEWQTACKGEKQTRFPWGDEFKPGRCNVFREEHPGHVLFGQFTVGMLDPRMNLVQSQGRSLLRKTGESSECKSVCGDDAIYDMVGNLDEWIDDPDGTFVGGFYARNTKKGCEQVVTGHPAGYMDYSLGGRCCRDLSP